VSDRFSIIPDIDFAVKNASEIEQAVITGFEAAWLAAEGTHLTLYPADPRRLFLLTIADLIVAQRVAIDFAAKQNLLKYARGNFLDNIAALYGERGRRLQPTYARTTLRFSILLTLAFDVLIPIDTRAAAGSLVFSTTEPTTLRAGTNYADAPAVCLTQGRIGNGIIIGQVNTLINWALPFAAQVVNTTNTEGGSELEDDEHYRERIWEAPESFSTCGPTEAYHFWAMSASPDLLDVLVYSDPSIAGEVWLYPLMRGGELPTQSILDAVYEACNDRKRRPLTDEVHVALPVARHFGLELMYWILFRDQVKAGAIRDNIQRAVEEWILWTRSMVGRDIIPDELIRRIIEAGAKRCQIITPPFTVVEYNELAICDYTVIDWGGFENP
jgi:phage-related baseplate assembly protein